MSGGRLGAVALSVFRESVRDRVFYNLLLFAVLLVGAAVLVGQMTAGQDIKIIKDLGLAATSAFEAPGGIRPLIRASNCQGTLYFWAIFSIVSPGCTA